MPAQAGIQRLMSLDSSQKHAGMTFEGNPVERRVGIAHREGLVENFNR
jgi:hypothetical protein